MNEELRRLGQDGRLSGIVTLPRQQPHRAMPRPAVIFITAGLVHKPGPHRLYVQLARTLAASGFTCLRFDLSGIGESRPRNDGTDAEQAAVNDVREVIDGITEEHGTRGCILVGLCSGAEVAHRTAVQDERVRGFVALDGYIQRTWKYYLWHYLPRVFSLRKWTDFLRQRLGRLRAPAGRAEGDPEQDALEFWTGSGPSRETLEQEFRSLVERKVSMLQIFSGGSGDCSYKRQFHDVFRNVDFRDRLSVRFIPRADHMYILSADRRKLIRTIARWVYRNFPRETPGRVTAAQPARGAATDQRTTAPAALANRTETPAQVAGRRYFE